MTPISDASRAALPASDALPHEAGNTGAPASEARVSGILYGARVITLRGHQPVETLRAGDRLVTRGEGVATIERIEHQSTVAPAVYVIAGTLGHYQASKDTMLPKDQPVLLRDWRAQALHGKDEIVVPAVSLVDGEFVRDLGLQVLSCYHIYVGAPRILYIDGMELGSADWQDSGAYADLAISRAST